MTGDSYAPSKLARYPRVGGDMPDNGGQGSDAPAFFVICGHGDENGFVFGEYAPHIDTSCLVKGSLGPQELAGGVNLFARVVLSTAVAPVRWGSATLLSGGRLRAYIAPHHFINDVLCRRIELEAAYLRARSRPLISRRRAEMNIWR